MNAEQLMQFCNPSQKKVSAPFTYGEFTYATNGHILVRVPKLADVMEWEAINGRAEELFSAVDIPLAMAAMTEIPDVVIPGPVLCRNCKGTGKITVCHECEGEGEVTVGNEYSDYNCDCNSCNGKGSLSGGTDACQICGGVGRVAARQVSVRIGPTFLADTYLAQIRALPGAKIAPLAALDPCYFAWDGGEGLLMPMRA